MWNPKTSGTGISHADIRRKISSKITSNVIIHGTAPYIRFTNDASTGTSHMTGPIKTIEPVTTLFDDGKFLRIITELPGIAEEKIRVDLENSSTMVTILAADTVVQYKKVITVPCDVKFSKKRFSDGILELILEKN
jgi:HSP20 family molecular chaperone IbpA